MFDWPRFLSGQGITYVTRGPNTTKNSIAIRCPWCGNSDPSEHLSISLQGQGYRCFRNPRAHAGRSRSRLIRELLHCSSEEAQRLAGEDVTPTPKDEDLPSQLATLLGGSEKPQETVPAGPLIFPPEFKPIRSTGLSSPFWAYLRDERGYAVLEIERLVQAYNLKYATQGRYRYRIIIPIETAEGKLASWTARSIVRTEELRYDTLTTRSDGANPVALAGAKSLLLGVPYLLRVVNPEILVLVEGPFDAFRVTMFGHSSGIYATCLFGLEATEAQVILLERLMRRFRKLILLLDPDADIIAFRIREQLQPLPVQVERLPKHIKDPAELSSYEAEKLFARWLAFNQNRVYIGG